MKRALAFATARVLDPKNGISQRPHLQFYRFWPCIIFSIPKSFRRVRSG